MRLRRRLDSPIGKGASLNTEAQALAEQSQGTREPPRGLLGSLRYLGPGMVVAAGLVGSGELIATTKAGAQAGIGLLWVIVIGCVVKVFTQIELGRYTVSTNETTLVALNRVPGPRLRANWILWLWVIMMTTTYGMLGGILGGVGQALALTLPLTGDFAQSMETGAAAEGNDPRTWAIIITAATAALLYFGRYRLLEMLCVAMVLFFTLITAGNVIALQTTDYAIPTAEILRGLAFAWPDQPGVWFTALAAFGIIGVGGTDLIAYPYWCLERGYARYIGPSSADPDWGPRARGWLRVMKIDAFASLCVYTLTTVAFFFIGAAVLHADGSDPDGLRMVATLATAYVPVFGNYAKLLFMAGALAVLYSTFLVANAGAARLFTDFLTVIRLLPDTDSARARSLGMMSLGLPTFCLLIFLTGWNPVRLVVFGGLVQSIVLPAIGFGALYFRFRLTDPRLHPGRAWDAALLLSCLSLLVVGLFSLYQIVG